jgi:Sulfotransferase family
VEGRDPAPLFIFGPAGSGTTLLMRLLDGHPQLVVDAGESRFFSVFLREARGRDRSGKIDLAEEVLLRHFLGPDAESPYLTLPDRDNNRNLTHIPYPSVRSAFRKRVSRPGTVDSELLPAAILAYGEVSGQLGPGSRFWVEKTPLNERHGSRILSWWPEAKAIQLVRDPRDNFSTLRKRNHRRGRLGSFVFMWRHSARLLSEYRAAYGGDRVLGVRYEDLALEPRRQMRTIIEFLGIEDHHTLYRPTAAGGLHQWEGNSAFGVKFDGIDPRSVGRWRTTLAPHERDVLEGALRAEMAMYGYPPSAPASFISSLLALPYRSAAAGRTIAWNLARGRLVGRSASPS